VSGAADPNKGKIDVVPTDEFLTQSWYRSPTNRADDNVAYWDGEWLGFYPTDPEAAAVHDPPVEWVLDRHGIQKALIVSGDDYGLTPDVNQGVVGGLQDGLLTSASIQPSAPHAASAMDIAAQTPGKGYGVHLTLTRPAWASIGPVSDRSEVRSLVGANGLFPTSVWAVLAWAKSADVERELRAQIESVLARGVYVDHLDCHDGWCNMMDRRLDAIFLRLAKEYQLPVRWGSAAGERLLQHNLAAPSNLILPNTNDQLSDYERRKRTVIGQIRKTQRGEISELVLHPQQGDVQHNQAFRVLDSTLMMDDELRQTLVAEGIELVDYGILEEIQERMGQ
jgi:hypothetical protein